MSVTRSKNANSTAILSSPKGKEIYQQTGKKEQLFLIIYAAEQKKLCGYSQWLCTNAKHIYMHIIVQIVLSRNFLER